VIRYWLDLLGVAGSAVSAVLVAGRTFGVVVIAAITAIGGGTPCYHSAGSYINGHAWPHRAGTT